MTLRIHSVMWSSRANGPGRRAVLWLQGCSLHCPGCWNRAAHSRRRGAEERIGRLVAWTYAQWSAGAVSGLTISGGEPLEQAPALAEFLETLHRLLPALSIGLFSGYSERELEQGRYRSFPEATAEEKRRLWRRIRACLDFAVLGRFNERQPSTHPLVTSRNQQLRLYSDRYTHADFAPQSVEFTIDGQGFTQVTGFPVG